MNRLHYIAVSPFISFLHTHTSLLHYTNRSTVETGWFPRTKQTTRRRARAEALHLSCRGWQSCTSQRHTGFHSGAPAAGAFPRAADTAPRSRSAASRLGRGPQRAPCPWGLPQSGRRCSRRRLEGALPRRLPSGVGEAPGGASWTPRLSGPWEPSAAEELAFRPGAAGGGGRVTALTGTPRWRALWAMYSSRRATLLRAAPAASFRLLSRSDTRARSGLALSSALPLTCTSRPGGPPRPAGTGAGVSSAKTRAGGGADSAMAAGALTAPWQPTPAPAAPWEAPT